MIALIQLSESEKRVIFAFLLLFILLLVIIAFVGYLIMKSIKRQGKKIEKAVYDVVVTRVITDPKEFKAYAKKKNWQMFFDNAKFAAGLLLTSFMILVIRNAFLGWDYNPWGIEEGFGSLLFVWDFTDPTCYKEFFGINLLADWPPLINSPHFVSEAWVSYIVIPMFLFGIIWYLRAIHCLIARTLHINKLAISVFEKDLSTFNQNTQLYNSLGAQQQAPAINNDEQNKTLL